MFYKVTAGSTASCQETWSPTEYTDSLDCSYYKVSCVCNIRPDSCLHTPVDSLDGNGACMALGCGSLAEMLAISTSAQENKRVSALIVTFLLSEGINT